MQNLERLPLDVLHIRLVVPLVHNVAKRCMPAIAGRKLPPCCEYRTELNRSASVSMLDSPCTRPTEPLGLLLVEPDPSVRAHLVELCAQTGATARVIAEVSLGVEAFQTAEALRPDVIFMASSLSDMSGLEAVRALRDRYRRRAILAIANLQERSEALAAGVLDYLMRPIKAEAFETSLLRARGRFGARKLPTRRTSSSYSTVSFRSELECDRPFVLIAEREQRLYPVQPRHIDYVESAGNYVKLHVDKCEYIARGSMKKLEATLGRAGFVRIERTLLLNILAISFVETVGHGAFAFTLSNGVRLHSGPAYRETILRALPLRRRAWAGEERERGDGMPVSYIPRNRHRNA